LSPLSKAFTASLSAFTTSAGLFWDLPNSGMILGQQVNINASTNHLSRHSGIRISPAYEANCKMPLRFFLKEEKIGRGEVDFTPVSRAIHIQCVSTPLLLVKLDTANCLLPCRAEVKNPQSSVSTYCYAFKVMVQLLSYVFNFTKC
jgi:hypothetical protein